MDGENEIKRLCEALNVQLPQALLKPRREVQVQSLRHQNAVAEVRLGSWQNRLGDEEIKAILDVVNRAGITGYNEDPMSFSTPSINTL